MHSHNSNLISSYEKLNDIVLMKCGNIVIIDIAILKATLPGGWTKLFDIPSGTISSTAATGLTVLLSSLFSHIGM